MSAALWNVATVPESVSLTSANSNAAVTLEEWAQWHDHDRYALYKTATSANQPQAFAQVLDELRDGKPNN